LRKKEEIVRGGSIRNREGTSIFNCKLTSFRKSFILCRSDYGEKIYKGWGEKPREGEWGSTRKSVIGLTAGKLNYLLKGVLLRKRKKRKCHNGKL